MSRSRNETSQDRADLSVWPTVAWSALPEEQQKIYRAREEAVHRYCQREPLRSIEAATGISYAAIRRLFARCLQSHDDGRVQGFRALIPYEHVKPYQRLLQWVPRKRVGGNSGAFSVLLERYPALEALISDELQAHHVILRQGSKGLTLSGLAALHRRFLQACLELGITERDYPLAQKQRGIRSLAAATRAIAERSFDQAARAALAQKRSGGVRPSAEGLPMVAMQPYDAVEFDGHRVDVRLRVVFEQAPGLEESFEIERVWLLTILDVCSRAVLGYHVVLEPEYSRFDVLKTVERALVPYKAPVLTIPGLRYAPGAGMPSERFAQLAYAAWNWFRFDNARAHLAQDTLRVLTRIVGCGVHAGPAYHPNDRPHIERFFLTLASVLTHRLPGTTGEGIKDPRRRIAAMNKQAPAQVRLDELLELAAVSMANYNADAHSGLGGRSPLGILGYFLNEKYLALRWVADPMRRNLCLLQNEHEGHVRGSVTRGVRPYIHFFGARYTSRELASRAELIGRPVRIYFDAEDVRALRVFDASGRQLGVVEVQGGWRYTAHSLRMRKEILALIRERTMRLAYNADPVTVYLDHLRANAGKRRRVASKAERTRRVVAAGPISPRPPPGPVEIATASPGPVAPTAPGPDGVQQSGPVKGRRLTIGTGQVFSR